MNRHTKKIIFITQLVLTNLTAQISSNANYITDDANGTQRIVVVDIDGDNLVDVVSANKFDSSVSWFKNQGDGIFGDEQLIGMIQETIFVSYADLDNDLDIDIIAVSGPDDLVVWYENLDGFGNFSTQKVLSTSANGAYSAITGDLNGDNLVDVISASDLNDTIEWYENLGSGVFGTGQVISTEGNNGRYVVIADFDGDDDQDIAASSSGSEILSWYENLDGQGNFGPPQIIGPAGPATTDLFAADIDDDNDIDIVTVTIGSDRVSWYQNLDGQGNFSSEIIITSEIPNVRSLFVADLDNDDDLDILAAGNNNQLLGQLVWLENLDGEGTFSNPHVISNNDQQIGILGVYVEDVDDDGDFDVFAASQNDDRIAWYENLTVLGLEAFKLETVQVFPNPVQNSLEIVFSGEIKKVVMFNSLGNKLFTSDNIHKIDMSSLSSGLYILHIQTEYGTVFRKVLKE